jgi:uncharacterized MAPEG superfamily protein
MESFIIYALVLALVQIWLIPMTLNLHNLQWQFSDRSEKIERSDMLNRALRASDNLKETLPAFLALVLLAMVVEKDVSNLACWWLIFRVAHGLCYLFKINYVRTLAWLGALGSLILMACQIVT